MPMPIAARCENGKAASPIREIRGPGEILVTNRVPESQIRHCSPNLQLQSSAASPHSTHSRRVLRSGPELRARRESPLHPLKRDRAPCVNTRANGSNSWLSSLHGKTSVGAPRRAPLIALGLAYVAPPYTVPVARATLARSEPRSAASAIKLVRNASSAGFSVPGRNVYAPSPGMSSRYMGQC